jgi:hypothetical protein
MNIFFLDRKPGGMPDPVGSAKDLDDKRIHKMALESAQILCTIIADRDPDFHAHHGLYKPTHANHPCTVWAGESLANFLWLLEHAAACVHEAARRYDKRSSDYKVAHVLAKVERWAERRSLPSCFPESGWTKPKLAMPDEFKGDDTVDSYRRYFRSKPNVVYQRTHAPAWYYEPTIPRI